QEVDSEISNQLIGLMIYLSIEDDTQDLYLFINSPGGWYLITHHMYAMPPYPYLATDYGTQLSLFTHHMWIGGFLIVAAAAHATIFMVRDYDPTTRYNDLLDRVLRHHSHAAKTIHNRIKISFLGLDY
ncbi:hypothetical protein R6Q59_001579, partial [Mikania micrantha]